MDPNETFALNDHECLALCGALLEVMRSDRYATAEENRSVVAIVAEILAARSKQGDAGAYREPGADAAPVDEALAAADLWLSRAGSELSERPALDAALARVERPAARQLIYDAAFSLAAVDMVNAPELDFLDELADLWGLPRETR